MQAKHQRECEELRKAVEHRECMLRASKEENEYIRGELMAMSEQNFALLKANRACEDQQLKLEEANQALRASLSAQEERASRQSHEKHLDQITCSPIVRSTDTFAL
jgi:hypothetical protein